MGYRDETEHLRNRVEQLQDELAELKETRRGGDSTLYARRARQQTILLIALATLASAGAGLCVVPTTVALIEEHEMLETPSEVARARAFTRHTFRGTVDQRASLSLGPYGYVSAAPLVEDPRVIVRCDYACPPELERFARPLPSRERVFEGLVTLVEDDSFDQSDLEPLRAYALENHLTVSDLRVVTLQRRQESPLMGHLILLGMLAFSSLCLWIAVAWHRRALHIEPDMPIPSDYVSQGAGITLLLSIVTCRLYELYWIYRSTAQLRRLTGRNDLIPALDVMLAIATLGLWSFWVFYRNVQAVDDALKAAETHPPQVGAVVGLTFGSFLCGLLHWVLIYRVQEAYNRLALEKMAADDL